MIEARHIGTDGWAGVPRLEYIKSVSISQNSPQIDRHCDINVLCLLESEDITPTFSDDVLYEFDLILTWRQDVVERVPHARKFLYGTTWVEEFSDVDLKEDKISFLLSKKLMITGHRFRHMVFDHIQKNYHGFMPIHSTVTPPRIDSKNSVLNDYKFSIVMENHRKKNYFTEKIIGCFATKTIPIYWGCPNIGEYFDANGIMSFKTIDDLDNILKNISGQTYWTLIQSIEKNFEFAKTYYSIWERIDNEINSYLEKVDDHRIH